MNDARNNESSKVAKAIAIAVRNVLGGSWQDILIEFVSLENKLLKARISEDERIEIRRRIAEAEISLVSLQKMPFEDYEKIWLHLCFLGFLTMERKASMLVYRVIFLLKNINDKDVVWMALEELRACIEYFYENKLNELAVHFSNTYDRLHNKFHKKFE